MKGLFNFSIFALIFLMMACAPQGFDAQTQLSTPASGGTDTGKSGGTDVPPTPSTSELNTLENMKASDQTYNSQVYIDKSDWSLVLKVPMGFNPFISATQIPIPQIQGAQVKTEIDSDWNAFVIVRIPLKSILRGVSQLEASNNLPNGDALPKMPAGEPAGIALTISSQKSVKMNLYIAIEAVGVFVETPFDYPFPAYISFPIKNQAQTQMLGWFTLVPRKNEFNSGFFMSFKLPLEVSEILNKYL